MDEKLTPPKTFVAMAIITFQYGAYFGLRCGTVRSAHVHKGAFVLFTNSLFRFLFHFMFLQSLIVFSA